MVQGLHVSVVYPGAMEMAQQVLTELEPQNPHGDGTTELPPQDQQATSSHADGGILATA